MHSTCRRGTRETSVSSYPRRIRRPSTGGATLLLRAVRRFRRGERGMAAIESALGITVLAVALSVLMEIVNTVYASDEMGRAARAAARALAIDPDADACAAIRRELRLSADFDCGTRWALTVDLGVGPLALPETLDGDVQTGTGDLVLVRIGWSHRPFSFDDSPPDGDGGESDAIAKIAMGLARCE